MDKSLVDILEEYSITLEEFNCLCDDYTNYDLFERNSDDSLLRRPDGSPQLIGDYNDIHHS